MPHNDADDSFLIILLSEFTNYDELVAHEKFSDKTYIFANFGNCWGSNTIQMRNEPFNFVLLNKCSIFEANGQLTKVAKYMLKRLIECSRKKNIGVYAHIKDFWPKDRLNKLIANINQGEKDYTIYPLIAFSHVPGHTCWEHKSNGLLYFLDSLLKKARGNGNKTCFTKKFKFLRELFDQKQKIAFEYRHSLLSKITVNYFSQQTDDDNIIRESKIMSPVNKLCKLYPQKKTKIIDDIKCLIKTGEPINHKLLCEFAFSLEEMIRET